MEYEYWNTNDPKPTKKPDDCEFFDAVLDRAWKRCTLPPEEWFGCRRRWPKPEPAMVYLPWYHNGYSDDQYTLLGVYSSKAGAEAKIEDHKVNGDRTFEFEEQANWFITAEVVKT